MFKKFINLISKKKSKEKDNYVEIKSDVENEIVATTEEVVEDTTKEDKVIAKEVEESEVNIDQVVHIEVNDYEIKENSLIDEEFIKENE